MVRASSGYTIIEVLIVVAVTGLLFFSALVLVNGQQGDTQFSQAMQDLSSKMLNYVGQIKASSYPGIENYGCSLQVTPDPSPGRPKLVTSGGAQNACVVLGRVFEVQPNTPNSGIIHSYVVLGKRTYVDSAGATQQATSVDSASPEPAGTTNGSGAFSYVLVDDYSLNSGFKVLSSKSGSTEYDLIGVYNQLEGTIENAGAGANSIIAMKGYPYPGQSYPNQANPQLRQCLELTSTTPPCNSGNSPAINQWFLCVSDGASTGVLEVDASTTGITTKTSLQACS